MWLSWLDRLPVTEVLWVRLPVGAHTYCAGSVPSLGTYNPGSGCIWEATSRCFSLASIFLSLPTFLSKEQWKNILGWGLKKKPKDSQCSSDIVNLEYQRHRFFLTWLLFQEPKLLLELYLHPSQKEGEREKERHVLSLERILFWSYT